jgi:hypothetical protein
MASATGFEIFDLDCNRPIGLDEIERCARLVAALATARTPDLAFGDEHDWMTIDGTLVYGGLTPHAVGRFEPDFVRHLRLHSYIFTATHLSDILSGHHTPTWLDAVQGAFPGDWPDWSIPAFRMFRNGIPGDLALAPPLVAGEVGFNVDGVCVNRDLIALQERINLLFRNGVLGRLRAQARPRILEIGGGYGGLAYFLTRILPDARYVIVDLPSSLMYSGCYLTVAQSSHPVRVGDGTRPDDRREIELVVPNAAAALAEREFDLAINTMSFAEMAPSVVRGYAALIRACLGETGLLFEQNFSLGHVSGGHFCSPDQVLEGVFPNRLDLSGINIWGHARLWSSAPLAQA